MSTKPHLKQARQPMWWRATAYMAATVPFLLLVAFWWMRLDVQERELPDWKPVLTQAELYRKKGDLYQANSLYSHTARIASWRNDWEGLLAAACGVKKLGGADGYFGTTYTLVVRAMLAAETRQSRTGIYAVAKAFTAIGEQRSASLTLSRVQKGWTEPTDGSSSDDVLWGCWEPDEIATARR